MSDIHDPRTWNWLDGVPESLANTKVRMAIKTFTIRRNADGTVTVSANNYRESFEIAGKSDEELFEAVKYALIMAHFSWTDKIEELVRSELDKNNA